MEDTLNKQVLSFEQVSRLSQVLNEKTFAVHGRGNFPTLDINLKDLINYVTSALREESLTVRDVRMNGGAASYILGREDSQDYNDLDLIFGVEIRSHNHLTQIKNSVLASLLNFLPSGVSKERMTSCTLKEAYVQKMVKISNATDRWSLISLYNNEGKNIELKFVDTMKRQFEFSVDSFQIILDSLLSFYEVSTIPMNPNFFPTVMAESVYGCFKETVFHLENKLIATRNPEEIRGGGLLKYCDLLVKGFTPKSVEEMKILERYMCSRFFIDFGDIEQQKSKLESYLLNHFIQNDRTKYEYLMTLYNVVGRSTVCLMGHERRQTLNLISMLARDVYTKAFPEVQFNGGTAYVAVSQNVNYVYQSSSTGPWQNYTNLVPCY